MAVYRGSLKKTTIPTARAKEGNFPSVIIVGAGISGLACAAHLTQHGLHDVTILEARDRIGGRIATVRPPNADDSFFYEAGAQWIHGCHGNRVKEFADANSIKSVKHDETTQYLLEGGGNPCCDPDVIDALNQAKDTFAQIIQDIEDNKDIHKHKDIQAYLDENWRNQTSHHLSYVDSLYRCLLSKQCVEEGCNSMKDCATLDYSQYQWCPGGDQTVVDGLDRLVDKLASTLPRDSVLLQRKVVNIDWRCPDGQVHVRATDLVTGSDDVFQADVVVVTMPLGVLKHQHSKLFIPKLPEDKVEAIENLGFGCVTKVIFRFAHNLYDQFPVSWIPLRRNPFVLGYYIATLTSCHSNNEQFIIIWLSGNEAKKAEEMCEEKLIEIFTDDFRKFQPDLPRPISAHVTRWTSDPYTRGSYTYIDVVSSGDDVIRMAEPLRVTSADGEVPEVKVLFAGEATHKTYFSTMHGAYESGIREAERILTGLVESAKRNGF